MIVYIFIYLYQLDPVWNNVSPSCKDLIQRMITKPEKRLTAMEILNHPWLKETADTISTEQLPKIVTNCLQFFCASQKIRKAVLTYMATQISQREIGEIDKYFRSLDKNGDGMLSMEEILDGLKGHPNQAELYKLVEYIDTDGSSFIDYNGNYWFIIFY